MLRGAEPHDKPYILYRTHFITSRRAEKSTVCKRGTSGTAFAQFTDLQIGQSFE
jgi:hypothetical protein